jgi:non-homologous end joining protein Ku
MEQYTLKTTKIDLKKSRITEEEYKLICSFIKARDKHNLEEAKMHDYYERKFMGRIKFALNKNELQDIKEELRSMPESCSKTLMFRSILMKEDELSV